MGYMMSSRAALALGIAVCVLVILNVADADSQNSNHQKLALESLSSPILLGSDSKTAYRDPTAIYYDGTFYLYFTYVRTEEDGKIYLYTAVSTSKDLKNWTDPKIITPKGQRLNYCSPGNVIRHDGDWVLCLQTYPIPGLSRDDSLRWANENARIFTMRSEDLLNWSKPELIRAKGPKVPREEMGRMIDAYFVEDKDEPGKWWCFYKQNGASMSWSRDLETWHYAGRVDSGENVCVIVRNQYYYLFHSPGNGVGIKRSPDLKHWENWGDRITLGQEDWPWAETRLTAGFVLDMRDHPEVGKYLMFFHGVGPGAERTIENAFADCSIGIAWSDDLCTWNWPGKPQPQ